MNDLIEYFKIKKNLINLLSLLILVLGLPIGVNLARQQQIFSSRAAAEGVQFIEGSETDPNRCVISRNGSLIARCANVAIQLTAPPPEVYTSSKVDAGLTQLAANIPANFEIVKTVYAADCNPDGDVDPNTWTLIEEWACVPGQPGVEAHKWICFGDDGAPRGDYKYTDGRSVEHCGGSSGEQPQAPVPFTPGDPSAPQPPSGGAGQGVPSQDCSSGQREFVRCVPNSFPDSCGGAGEAEVRVCSSNGKWEENTVGECNRDPCGSKPEGPAQDSGPKACDGYSQLCDKGGRLGTQYCVGGSINPATNSCGYDPQRTVKCVTEPGSNEVGGCKLSSDPGTGSGAGSTGGGTGGQAGGVAKGANFPDGPKCFVCDGNKLRFSGDGNIANCGTTAPECSAGVSSDGRNVCRSSKNVTDDNCTPPPPATASKGCYICQNDNLSPHSNQDACTSSTPTCPKTSTATNGICKSTTNVTGHKCSEPASSGCYVCDGGKLRPDGDQGICNRLDAPTCPNLNDQNVCKSTDNDTGDTCTPGAVSGDCFVCRGKQWFKSGGTCPASAEACKSNPTTQAERDKLFAGCRGGEARVGGSCDTVAIGGGTGTGTGTGTGGTGTAGGTSGGTGSTGGGSTGTGGTGTGTGGTGSTGSTSDVRTVAYRIAQDIQALSSAPFKTMTQEVVIENITLASTTIGQKFVWAEFKDNHGRIRREGPARINFVGQDPKILNSSCDVDITKTGLVFRISGVNFGNSQSNAHLTGNGNNLNITTWSDTGVTATYNTALGTETGTPYKITLTRPDGQATEGLCRVGVTEVAVKGVTACPIKEELTETECVVVDGSTIPAKKVKNSKCSITPDGIVKGLPVVQDGKSYRFCIKPKNGVRRCGVIKIAAGTNYSPLDIRLGEISGDGKVNARDYADLKRQFGLIASCPPTRPGDLVRDCKVNVFDGACMFASFNQEDEPEDGPTLSRDSDGQVCAQVITRACRNDTQSICQDFPSPCDVPAGWSAVR